MANHGQHQQGSSASSRSGAGQSIVELCTVSACGLVFWSRQRFEIGSELQIRVRRDALDKLTPKGESDEEWITVSGFVVECPAVRRPSGEHGFEVSLLLESALVPEIAPRRVQRCPTMRVRLQGHSRMGLN